MSARRRPEPWQVKQTRKTAELVWEVLPSSYMPMEITVDEAIGIGKRLFPEWICVAVRNTEKVNDLNCLLEMLGRGFMYPVIVALPPWLMRCWLYKVDMKGEDGLEQTIAEVYNVEDAEKLAKYWIELACGWSEDDVTEEVFRVTTPEEPDRSKVPAWLEERFKALEDE